MEKQTGSKLGRKYDKAVYCHSAYLTYVQSTSCEMTAWINHKPESRVPGKISATQICRWYQKEPLDEGEKRQWKDWLKTQHPKNKDHSIKSHHFIANRWGNNGNSDRLFSWAPKSLQMVTAAMKLKDTWKKKKKKKDTCSLEEKLWPTWTAY